MEFSLISYVAIIITLATGPFYLFATYYFAGVGLRQTSTMTAGLIVFASIIIWFVHQGQFMFSNAYVMPAVMLSSLAIPSLLVLLAPKYFVPENISLTWLLGVQAFRVIGGLYLLEFFRGNVGAEFAYWAGIGDVITGIAASTLLLFYLFTKRMPRWAVLAVVLFGIADFAWAYTIGILSFDTPIQVFAINSVHATNLFPIAMIPFLLAPIAMAFMLMTLIKLKHSTIMK